MFLKKRNISLLLVSAVCFASWTFVFIYFNKNKEAILIRVEEISKNVLLPYRIAKLSTEPVDTELPVPVEGILPHNIADTWNQPRSGGRKHEGVDIFSDQGTPVYSATRGYVMRIGQGNLGGNFVFTVGPGGRRYYYAHLDSVPGHLEVGDEISTTTIIGFVGNTGNASGTPHHLHFGMYDNGPQNPYPLLVKRP